MAETIEHINTDVSTDPSLKLWKFLYHFSSLAMLLMIPFANIWGPLIVWKKFGQKFPQLDEDAKEELNFQISVDIILSIIFVIIIAAQIFVSISPGVNILEIYLILPLIVVMFLGIVLDTVLVVRKCMAIYSDGADIKYPFSFGFVR